MPEQPGIHPERQPRHPEVAVLIDDDMIAVNAARPMYGVAKSFRLTGVNAAITAELQVGERVFHIFDLGEGADTRIMPSPFDNDNVINKARYLVAERLGSSSDYHYESFNMKGLRENETVQLGTDHYRDRFSYDKTVEPDHTVLTVVGSRIVIKNQAQHESTMVKARRFEDVMLSHDAAIGRAATAREAEVIPLPGVELDHRQEAVFAPFVMPDRPLSVLNRLPSDASLERSAAILNNPTLDPKFREIISNFVSPKAMVYEVVTAVASDPDLRLHLASYLLAKIRTMHGLPTQVLHDSQKVSRVDGYYRTVTSREYAVLLAMSNLDGSFKEEMVPRSDSLVAREDGVAELGQHRYMAARLLFERSNLLPPPVLSIGAGKQPADPPRAQQPS